MKFSKSLFASAAAALLALAPLASQASLTLTVQDLVTSASVTVTDGVGGDLLDGVASYSGTVGNWFFTSSQGFGTSVQTDPFGLHLNASASTNVAGSTLRVSVTEDNLTNFAGTLASLLSSIGGVTGGNVTYSVLVNGSTVFTGQSADHMVAGNAFADSGAATSLLSNPYSLTLTADIYHATGGKVTSLDFEGSIPEPTSFALAGLALLGLGLASRRRKA